MVSLPDPLEFTEGARDALERRLAARGTPHSYVRFGVKGGGCTGYSYVVEYDDEPDLSKSIAWQVGAANVVMDVKSAELLRGTRVTYRKTLMHEGFDFENPNEVSRCSCGSSFAVKR